MATVDYPLRIGHNSIAAAVVFSILLYLPLLVWYIFQSFRYPTEVYFFLVFFCFIRMVAFILRAALAGSESVNFGAVAADQVLFNVGFYALLYSSYVLVLDLQQMTIKHTARNLIVRITQSRYLFDTLIFASIVLNIVGTVLMSNIGLGTPTSMGPREASTVITLIMVLMIAMQTLYYAHFHRTVVLRSYTELEQLPQPAFGAKHSVAIMSTISILLLIRQVFATATLTSTRQYNEYLWYPLYAMMELLAVICYLARDLVPSAKEMDERAEATRLYQGHPAKTEESA